MCPKCEKRYLAKPPISRVFRGGGLVVVSLAKYGDEGIRSAIHLLKYRSVIKYGEALGKLLAQKLPKKYFADSILVPIPTGKGTLRERGFNQAKVIAETIARKKNVEIIEALEKTKSSSSQVAMESKKQRRENIKGSFGLVCQKEVIRGKKVILVDDVVTTGATLMEGAKILRLAKPQSVRAVTVASD